ncbi:hypothetical protein PMKS-000933 [Pichia membranifaciens]|uniref:pyridoxal kinase n=1 Tax=Pichia membranifaciens TaxID=4926 RepID=A0A1Q2YD69_9ASCO|nr:hypothetical protein PMKS-000933 [Pichia membranifaciens]
MDPVIGDNGKVYVSQETVDLYLQLLGRNEIDIDLLTPNMFEMEVLTGVQINSWETVKKSIDVFCEKYVSVKNLVITSVTIDGKMYCVGSSKGKSFYYSVSEIDAVFSGSGDLFLALLTDELVKNEQGLAASVYKTINVVTGVLNLSYQLLKDDCTTMTNASGKLYIPDLKLVESKNILIRDVQVTEPTYLE